MKIVCRLKLSIPGSYKFTNYVISGGDINLVSMHSMDQYGEIKGLRYAGFQDLADVCEDLIVEVVSAQLRPTKRRTLSQTMNMAEKIIPSSGTMNHQVYYSR